MQTLVIGIVLVIVIWASVGCLFIDYATHVDMNKREHCPYDFVRFDTFIKEFNKYKDDPRLEIQWNESVFLRKNYQDIVYLHASIVKFNGKCMIFYPIGWVMYCNWKKRFIKKKSTKRCKGLWS